ncbi:MAG: class I adenylate-forming enzyme family protein [Pseudomonadota bacterium]|jgi:acyl-CoA synthetase (AMP-forming)/AMP-acid ligase II|nr:class I adenylate-forming enzyme family protein [Pseudomonadota bacterium]
MTATTREARHRQYRDKGWWGDETLHTAFDKAVAAAPGHVAIVDPPDCRTLIGRDPQRLSYQDISNASHNLAARLAQRRIGRGDAVLVQLPNTVELSVLYLALSRLGAIISPVPMQYGRHEIGHMSRELDAKAFVGIESFKGEAAAARMTAALPDTVPVLTFGGSGEGETALAVDTSEPRMLMPSAGEADDIFTVCWTSGTTGTPKGVPRTHNHWFSQVIAIEDTVPLEPGSAMLNPFPMTNMAALSGFFFYWPLIQATLVLHHPFDLPTFLTQLTTEKVAYTIAPPAVLNLFLQNTDLHDKFDLSAVKYIASGSAPLDPWMVKGFRDKFGIEIINFFGSNEGIGLCGGPAEVPDPEQRATLFPRFGREGIDWDNRFGQRFETKLVDWNNNDREILEPGVPGEMLIRGPNVFDGYLNDAGQDVFDGDGYFRTGDLFEIAGEGDLARYYRFKGRRKELIIRGGMNISPEELDGLISAHPKIQEAAVCGYPDAVMGEKVCLFAVPKPGESLTLKDVTGFLEAEGVAKFKWPEKLVLVDALPRNPLNKVVRSELRDQLEPA